MWSVTPGCWLSLNSAFWRAEAGGSREKDQGDAEEVTAQRHQAYPLPRVGPIPPPAPGA